MIHDFLLFLYFTASLNFQSKARQLIVEPIRQTVVRIVLWFEEIYMFNSMSNILYKHLGLIVFRGELTKENYKFRFLSFSKLGGREGGGECFRLCHKELFWKGYGKYWCNGDCQWKEKCQPKEESVPDCKVASLVSMATCKMYFIIHDNENCSGALKRTPMTVF